MAKPATDERKHFVLIHGACHGAWCWYKVKAYLKMAGHKVTALDMTAAGINTSKKTILEVQTMNEYSEPLLDFTAKLPPDEKVVLVGHSLGGISLAIAMERFPEKVSVAVFLTAFLPDMVNPKSYVLQQLFATAPAASWLDTIFTTQDSHSDPPAIIFFGPECLKQKLYQNCPTEDIELAEMLKRPASLYINDLSTSRFSAEAYGSVKRVYVKCGEDLAISEEFQQWMIENYGGPVDVTNIPLADHMAMLSTPKDVVRCLLEAARKYT